MVGAQVCSEVAGPLPGGSSGGEDGGEQGDADGAPSCLPALKIDEARPVWALVMVAIDAAWLGMNTSETPRPRPSMTRRTSHKLVPTSAWAIPVVAAAMTGSPAAMSLRGPNRQYSTRVTIWLPP